MARGESEPDYYEVLMVPEGATDEEIRAQYRRLAAVLHPDANPQRPDLAGERMKLLNEAKDMLLDPARRAEYDARRRAIREAAEEEERSEEWPEEPAGCQGDAGIDFEPGSGSGGGGWAGGATGAPQTAGRGRVGLRLPLTGVRGAAGYFLASRAAYRVLRRWGVQWWVWTLVLPLVIADVVHAVVTFFLLSWWLGESPLATYPVALVALSYLTYFAGLWERGVGWVMLVVLGAGAVARAATLPRYVRTLKILRM